MKLPYLGNFITLPWGPSYPTVEPQLPYLHQQENCGNKVKRQL
jgi:hypothetical protein